MGAPSAEHDEGDQRDGAPEVRSARNGQEVALVHERRSFARREGKNLHQTVSEIGRISNKQTKCIVTLLQTEHAYFKPKGFSGKNRKSSVTILQNRINITFPINNICKIVSCQTL